ncbi:MAG: ABC transporter substrate-binding protein [Eggerthellaceae bacterium]|jgi:peptide/nickel transport system substrate-binding protein|nr:ABC transporter substrate-binding protein [Eggerthellaceae bacterium]MCH4220421.1 ABC transporter substrate-binding protein [Eggerthellaceae bacterium]
MVDNNHCMSRRQFVVGACATAFAYTTLGQLTGCATSNDNEGTTHDLLTIVYNDAPNSFDPANKWDGWYTSCRGLTETLVAFDEQMNLIPCLSTEWTNEDSLTWRFTIRQGVTFHTGRALTPEAVKASLERSITKSSRAASKLNAASIDVEGNDIVITTTKPVATLSGEIVEPVFSIVDVDHVDSDPSRSGTGPYYGENVDSTENFTLSAFADYWDGAPGVATLNCQTVTDANARAMGLRSGDANIAASLLANDLTALQHDNNYSILTSESVRQVFMICNFANEFLADKAVRQALSYATDRETLCNNLLGGNIYPNGLPFPSYLSYAQAVEDDAQTYDLDKANQLLTDAGYIDSDGDGYREKNGRKISLTLAYYGTRPELPVLAPALQDAYKQIGVEIVPQFYENVDNVYYNGSFDLCLYNTTTIGNGDPSYYLKMYFLSTGSENAGKFSNAELDQIITDMQQNFDQSARFDAAQQAECIILDECPDIFFGTARMNAVCGKGVSGYEVCPVEYYGVTSHMA